MDQSTVDRIRVLHVEDDGDFAEMVATCIERENDRLVVETATSAGDGLDRLEDGGVDCIVSDYDMGQRNGIEFLEAVREDHPELPFILFTGKGSEEVASDAISAGVTDYLQKETGADQYAILANRVVNAVERARAEQAKRRHLDAIEAAQEGISIVAESGEYVYVNQAYADIYGYEPEEMLGESFTITYPDEDIELVQADVIPDLEKTGVWSGETTGVRADGTTFVEDHTLAKTKDGELICSVWDKSERKSRERAIEGLHCTVRSFMQATSFADVAETATEAVRDILGLPAAAVYRYDEDEDCLAPTIWTEETEAILGEPPAFPRGEGIAWQVFEDGERRVYDDVSTAEDRLNEDTPMRSEMILPLGDHGVLLVGVDDADAFETTDVPLAQTLAVHATTALDGIASERDLREEREFVDQALNALADVFYVLDTDGMFRRWNDRLAAATGYEDGAIGDLELSDLFPEDDSERVRAAIATALSEGHATIEADLVTADGDRVPYEFTGARLTDTSGDVTGVVGMGRDISERTERERRLERQNERLSEFASIVSHDLRNPLSVARGRMEMIQEECDSEHVDPVVGAHDRMETMIDEILTLAREGDAATEPEFVPLADVAADCWRNVETDEASLSVQTDLTIRADRCQLQQLLENLFHNAVEHGSASRHSSATRDGTVKYSSTSPPSHAREDAAGRQPSGEPSVADAPEDAVEHDGEGVKVTVGDADDGFYVADDGQGIPEPDRDGVFEAGRSSVPGGTGLGLRIVEQISDGHGWTVDVHESEGGGARIVLSGVETRA